MTIQQSGQINRSSLFGSYIYNISLNKNTKNIVEIGTWNGLGSTKCVMDAIQGDITKHLTTVEMYPDMHQLAQKNITQYLNYNLNQITILNGTIIDPDMVYWFDHSTIDFIRDKHAKLWYDKDMSLIKEANNVLNYIPLAIDFLILDGGEYTTYPEYLVLKDRCKIIALDDTNILKCNKIFNELKIDSNYKCIIHQPDERNGFAIFEKI